MAVLLHCRLIVDQPWERGRRAKARGSDTQTMCPQALVLWPSGIVAVEFFGFLPPGQQGQLWGEGLWRDASEARQLRAALGDARYIDSARAGNSYKFGTSICELWCRGLIEVSEAPRETHGCFFVDEKSGQLRFIF